MTPCQGISAGAGGSLGVQSLGVQLLGVQLLGVQLFGVQAGGWLGGGCHLLLYLRRKHALITNFASQIKTARTTTAAMGIPILAPIGKLFQPLHEVGGEDEEGGEAGDVGEVKAPPAVEAADVAAPPAVATGPTSIVVVP